MTREYVAPDAAMHLGDALSVLACDVMVMENPNNGKRHRCSDPKAKVAQMDCGFLVWYPVLIEPFTDSSQLSCKHCLRMAAMWGWGVPLSGAGSVVREEMRYDHE